MIRSMACWRESEQNITLNYDNAFPSGTATHLLTLIMYNNMFTARSEH